MEEWEITNERMNTNMLSHPPFPWQSSLAEMRGGAGVDIVSQGTQTQNSIFSILEDLIPLGHGEPGHVSAYFLPATLVLLIPAGKVRDILGKAVGSLYRWKRR